MASQTEICNLALIRIGANTITDLGEGTREADLCNTLFIPTVEETISEGSWSRAIFRASLAKTTNTPAFRFISEFQLPNSPRFLKIINTEDSAFGEDEYAIEGDKLLTNSGAVNIRYVGLIEDTQAFGPYLTRTIVSRLAMELGNVLTSDFAKTTELERRYVFDLQQGLANDGQQGSHNRIISDDFTAVRNSSGTILL